MTVCCINYHWGLGVGINDLKKKKTSYNQSILPLMLPGTQGRKGMQSPSPPEGSTMGFPLPNILPAEKCQDLWVIGKIKHALVKRVWLLCKSVTVREEVTTAAW